MPVQWDQSMATGVQTVDDQHRQLIGYINDLLAAMSKGTGRQEVDRILTLTGQYAGTHFRHEEGCMRRYQCPTAVENEKAHAAFVQTFGGLRAEIERTGPTSELVLRVQKELADWVSRHIRKTDTALRTCVAPVH